MSRPARPTLSESQLALLADIGEERGAGVGDEVPRPGARESPFMAIVEGEFAILDVAGNELVRHGPAGFLGELNLLTGQTVFLNTLVVEAVRYIAGERPALRSLLHE